MRKTKTVFVILFLAVVNLTNADVFEVSKSGKYSCIAETIQLAGPFDTLLIQPGVYIEDSIFISKPLTIKGVNYPVIENKNNMETIIIAANNVIIEGLQVQNVKHSYVNDLAGIRLIKAKNCTIRNNKLINTFFGIYLQNSHACIIEHNEVTGQAMQEMSSGNAIHLWYCTDILIKGNKATGHRDGIYLEFVENSVLIDNESAENIRYGLHFMFSHKTSYINNLFSNNGTGVAVMYSDQITMEKNQFEDNWGTASYGILLKDIKNSKLYGNTFDNNTTAIYMDNSVRVHFNLNMFNQNGWGVKLLGSCNDNIFTGNTFTGNNFDISTDSRTSNNTFTNNYWGKYNGYDLNNDDFGDVAYNPVTLSSYLVSTYPASIILLRSLFLDVLDMVEKTTPVFVPVDLTDPYPLMEPPGTDKTQINPEGH